MTVDLAVLALLGVTALLGAASGALKQVVSLGAAALGVVAARAFAAPVAEGLARTIPGPIARVAAPALLFLGAFALASLAGSAVLRGTGVARAVRGPSDRAAGAILGGAKGVLAAWLLLSALALAGDAAPDALRDRTRESDFAALARAHNLVSRLQPDAARSLARAIDAARRARAAGALGEDPDSARLLEQLRGLEGPGGGAIDPERAAEVLRDPEVRKLVERLSARGPESTEPR
jgi:membrane protein required for colicin V production